MSQLLLQRPTWAEINLHNLAFNFHSIKSFISNDLKMMAVVKADAYGHGAVECSKRLEKEGIDWLGTALPQEALELRQAGIRKLILCLGSFWNGQEDFLLDNHITPVIFELEKARLFNQAAAGRGLIADVHIKIDTGMGRVGVRFDELPFFLEALQKLKNLRVVGLMTHFAAADDLAETDFTDLQIELFNKSLELFQQSGFNIIYRDLANSPATVAYPHARGNLVRIGGILYGLGDDVLPKGISKPTLKPVLSLHTRIAFLKKVPKGESLGYGRTFFTERNSLIATIPIGYQDGLPRGLSNCARVIINGHFAPIVGRISMDWTLVDVTDVPCALEDKVTLIGERDGLTIKAEELAQKTGTISYEITCGISRRVIRKYVGSKEK